MISRVRMVIVLGTALTLFSGSVAAQTKATKVSQGPQVGYIKDESIPGGCGCALFSPSERKKRLPKYVFFSGMDENRAWMNIDGRDVELTLTHASSSKGRERSRSSETYVRGSMKVSVVYVTTRFCKPNDEDGESTDYNATVTVIDGLRRRTLKLKGSCGC